MDQSYHAIFLLLDIIFSNNSWNNIKAIKRNRNICFKKFIINKLLIIMIFLVIKPASRKLVVTNANFAVITIKDKDKISALFDFLFLNG